MSIRVTSGMTKTDVLDAFVAASSKAGETLTITSDIPNVAVASFAVDVLRRKGTVSRRVSSQRPVGTP